MTRILVAILCIASSGCVDVPSDVKLKVETPDVVAAAKSLQTGIENLDAIGLKKILDENAELRKTADYLRSRLNIAPTGEGVIVADGQDIQFVIVQYTGAFLLNGWIDTEENWFWKDRALTRKDVTLNFDFAETWSVSGSPFKLALLVLDAKIPFLDAAKTANEGSERLFQKFLKESAFIPRPEDTMVNLNAQLGAGNLHRFVIVPTPIEGDQNGKWSLRGQIRLKRGDGFDKLKEFDIGSDISVGHALGKPLQPIPILLMVKHTPK